MTVRGISPVLLTKQEPGIFREKKNLWQVRTERPLHRQRPESQSVTMEALCP